MNFDTLSIRSFHEIDHLSFACSAHKKIAIYDGAVRLDTKFGSKIALGFFELVNQGCGTDQNDSIYSKMLKRDLSIPHL